MAFKIVRNDITKMKVDAIVNTANEEPIYAEGTDTAVYKAAGEELLLAERRKIGVMKEGDVAITPGFRLPAKYIIHAVSPYYIDGMQGEEEKLRLCYQRSLKLAHENQCKSIAFPLISTGSFGYPKEEGMRIAADEINAFLLSHDMLIYLVVFDSESTRLGRNLYPDLEAYIDQNYVADKRREEYGIPNFLRSAQASRSCATGEAQEDSTDECLSEFEETSEETMLCSQDEVTGIAKALSVGEQPIEELETALAERMKHLSDTFQQYLLYLIEAKGQTNAEVYNRAIISKQLFSKIKLNPDYHPDKATAMRLCVGAQLNLDETKDLLARAGYALSPCDKRDIIFSFFIEREIFDMIEIDIALEEHGLTCFI